MQVKETENKGLKRGYTVTVPADEMDKRVDARLQEIAKTARIKGFRPGKVPLQVVKTQYGDAVLGEIVEKAVNDGSAKALQDNKIKPASQPQVEIKSFAKGEALEFSVQVETLPEFKVIDVKGITLEKPVADVEDSVLEDALNRIAEQNKETQPVTTDRAAKKGDIVVIDFDGKVDGERRPGMKAEGHNLELGSNMFIPGFEDQLIGKKANDEVLVEVTFPEDYGSTELAGKAATFDVKIHELREPASAAINDDLAKRIGLEDLEALKKILREQMANEYSQFTRMKVKRALLDVLDEKHDFELPEMMVNQEYEMILRQVENERHHHADGAHDHNHEHHSHVSDDEREELKEIAHRRVKLGLVLAQIGTENKIQVSDNDLQQAVIAEARKYPGQEAQVFEFYKKNRNALESLRAPLFEEKVVDFILEIADVKEKKVSFEELASQDDDDEIPLKKKDTSKETSKSAVKTAKKPATKKEKDEKAPVKKTGAAKSKKE